MTKTLNSLVDNGTISVVQENAIKSVFVAALKAYKAQLNSYNNDYRRSIDSKL